MLKNNEIIEKLTTKQKIALLADSKEGVNEASMVTDLPSLSAKELWENELDEKGEAIFPSPASLANSWDSQIFGDIAHKLVCLKAQKGANLFIMPKVSAATSVYGDEATEDPFLSGILFAGAAKELTKASVSLCLQAPTVTDDDIGSLDKTADISALFERVARPFKMVKEQGKCRAILSAQKSADESYIKANEKMIEQTTGNDIPMITKIEENDNTVALINSGSQVIGGSVVAIETAYDNYKKIYRSLEEGGATTHELNMALLDGAAISDEIINDALERKISLANSCQVNGLYTTGDEIDHLSYEAARRSIVLVKNNKDALPLQKGSRVCVIGDIISATDNGQFIDFYDKLSAALKSMGSIPVGFKAGYRLDDDISDDMIAPAVSLAATADTALVFLGLGKQREDELKKSQRLMLPANQVALVSALAKTGKKIIAVVTGSRLPNMGFDNDAQAVLLAPSSGRGVARALAEIVVGRCNPSGKLAYAGYDNADAIFKQIQKRKQKGTQRIGKMVGYRYTDAAKKVAKYPFGHGLSYSRFVYSHLQVLSPKVVSVEIQNTSNYAGVETVQVYVGCNSSSRIRPVKELKGVTKVYVPAHQKKVIQITLSELSIYDTDTQSFVVETGEYTYYVGSSVSNIRLSAKVQLQGTTLKTHKRRISEYLRDVSNIRSESYTMEAHCKPMNNVSKLKTLSFWLFALTLFADSVYGICGVFFSLPFAEQMGTFFALNAISIGIAAICFIIYLVMHQKNVSKQKKKEKLATKELFRGAEKVNASNVEKLFVAEFDQIESQPELRKRTVTYRGKDESIYVYMAVETDFKTLCADMEKYFEANELIISSAMARSVVSALMSSRLLVLRNEDTEISLKFAHILSTFFGTNTIVDSLSNRQWGKDSLLYIQGAKNSYPSALYQAFYLAGNEPNKACFYTMTDVKLGEVGSFLTPYVQFLSSPLEKHSVTENGTTYTIPSNIWFSIIPKEGESLDSLPTFVTNLISVLDIDAKVPEKEEEPVQIEASTEEPEKEATENAKPEEKTDSKAEGENDTKSEDEAEQEKTEQESIVVKPITPHQLEALTYRSKKAAVIDEQIWKSVDSLEEFVNERTPYHIGNKIFLQLECYLSVYLACGGEISEAVDGVLSAKLLPTIMTMLKDNPQMADVDMIQTIESIFGEESVLRASKTIKYNVLESKKKEQNEAKEADLEEASDKDGDKEGDVINAI